MSEDINIIRADDPAIWDQIWERAQRKARERDAWDASPDGWQFDGVPTWDAIVAREPRLNSLAISAIRLGHRDRETYVTWYREIKPQIERLVGHHADDQPPPLQTSQVYDVVYQHLLKLYEVGA